MTDPRSPFTDVEVAQILRDHVPEFIPVPSADSENARIRHALCIALDVDPSLNEPTYDLLLRLLSSGRLAPKGVTFGGRSYNQTPDLIALLRQAEWAGGDIPACPWCGRTLSRTKGSAESHAPECPVVPILYPKEQG